jgi:SAM-dependent methyltransferase
MAINSKIEFLARQAGQYYTGKFLANGPTPQGVDWNGIESQFVRFEQLTKVMDHEKEDAKFKLLDYGCGYGAYYEFIKAKFPLVEYTGYDVSDEMVEYARNKYLNAEWKSKVLLDQKYDYVIASGVFNVKQNACVDEWQDYVLAEIEKMNTLSCKGMAFNLLTKYSDEDKMRPHLFYADPCFYFDLCKRKYSRNVALLHDYNLYEFTILIRN